MRKLLFMFMLLLGAGRQLHAQSIADLLIELELDKEKLSSMKNTLDDMYRGYASLKAGYAYIRDIAKANFELHRTFLAAMLAISPAVRDDPEIEAILQAAYTIASGYHAAGSRWMASGVFTAAEVESITSMYATLLESCRQSIEELTMVLTADQLRMSDAERIQAIGRIGADTQRQIETLQQLDDMLAIQIAQRLKAAGDINTLKSLYGLPD